MTTTKNERNVAVGGIGSDDDEKEDEDENEVSVFPSVALHGKNAP